jgi:hypothetical protein
MRMSHARHRGVGDAGRSVENGGSRPVLGRMPAAAAWRTPAGVLALQRTIGNRAVTWMLEDAQLVSQTLGLGQATSTEAGATAAGAASAGAAAAAATQAAGAASAGAAAAGAGGAASGGAAGAGPDPDLLEFDLKSTRRRSPR